MIVNVLSDQYYKWSDRHAKHIQHISEKETSRSITKSSRSAEDHSRIVDRALQAVRKTRMQMRNRRRSWTEALSLDAPAWGRTIDGICPAVLRRANQRISRKLSSGARNIGRDLPNQSRTFAAARETLIDGFRIRRDTRTVIGDASREHLGRGPPSGQLCLATV
jgi:hypothetical protein